MKAEALHLRPPSAGWLRLVGLELAAMAGRGSAVQPLVRTHLRPAWQLVQQHAPSAEHGWELLRCVMQLARWQGAPERRRCIVPPLAARLGAVTGKPHDWTLEIELRLPADARHAEAAAWGRDAEALLCAAGVRHRLARLTLDTGRGAWTAHPPWGWGGAELLCRAA